MIHLTSKKFTLRFSLSLKDFPEVTNVKKLTNFEPAYRLRIGNYRVLFDVIDDCIEIGRVLHRKESYKYQVMRFLTASFGESEFANPDRG